MHFKITHPPKLKNWKVSMTTNSTTIGPASYVSPMNKDITLKKYIFTPLYITLFTLKYFYISIL